MSRERKLSDATFSLLDDAVAKRDLNSLNSLLTRLSQMGMDNPQVEKARQLQARLAEEGHARADLSQAIAMQSLGMLQDAIAKVARLKLVDPSEDLQKDMRNAQLMLRTLSHSHSETRRQSQMLVRRQSSMILARDGQLAQKKFLDGQKKREHMRKSVRKSVLSLGNTGKETFMRKISRKLSVGKGNTLNVLDESAEGGEEDIDDVMLVEGDTDAFQNDDDVEEEGGEEVKEVTTESMKRASFLAVAGSWGAGAGTGDSESEEKKRAKLQRLDSYLLSTQVAFQIIDADNSGSITVHEFVAALKMHHKAKSSTDADTGADTVDHVDVQESVEMFKLMDVDGSGNITLDEFQDYCLQHQDDKALGSWFRQLARDAARERAKSGADATSQRLRLVSKISMGLGNSEPDDALGGDGAMRANPLALGARVQNEEHNRMVALELELDTLARLMGGVHMQGFLLKRAVNSGARGGWKRRFFVLSSDRLVYFKSRDHAAQQPDNPLGVFFITPNCRTAVTTVEEFDIGGGATNHHVSGVVNAGAAFVDSFGHKTKKSSDSRAKKESRMPGQLPPPRNLPTPGQLPPPAAVGKQLPPPPLNLSKSSTSSKASEGGSNRHMKMSALEKAAANRREKEKEKEKEKDKKDSDGQPRKHVTMLGMVARKMSGGKSLLGLGSPTHAASTGKLLSPTHAHSPTGEDASALRISQLDGFRSKKAEALVAHTHGQHHARKHSQLLSSALVMIVSRPKLEIEVDWANIITGQQFCCMFVRHLHDDSAASQMERVQRAQVQKGMVLVSVNGKPTVGLTYDKVKAMLGVANRPLELKWAVPHRGDFPGAGVGRAGEWGSSDFPFAFMATTKSLLVTARSESDRRKWVFLLRKATTDLRLLIRKRPPTWLQMSHGRWAKVNGIQRQRCVINKGSWKKAFYMLAPDLLSAWTGEDMHTHSSANDYLLGPRTAVEDRVEVQGSAHEEVFALASAGQRTYFRAADRREKEEWVAAIRDRIAILVKEDGMSDAAAIDDDESTDSSAVGAALLGSDPEHAQSSAAMAGHRGGTAAMAQDVYAQLVQGVLLKRGDIQRSVSLGQGMSWKERFFVLEGNQLRYHRNQTTTSVKGRIVLTPDCTVHKTLQRPHAFELVTPHRVVHMCAKSYEEQLGWIRALEAHIRHSPPVSEGEAAELEAGGGLEHEMGSSVLLERVKLMEQAIQEDMDSTAGSKPVRSNTLGLDEYRTRESSLASKDPFDSSTWLRTSSSADAMGGGGQDELGGGWFRASSSSLLDVDDGLDMGEHEVGQHAMLADSSGASTSSSSSTSASATAEDTGPIDGGKMGVDKEDTLRQTLDAAGLDDEASARAAHRQHYYSVTWSDRVQLEDADDGAEWKEGLGLELRQRRQWACVTRLAPSQKRRGVTVGSVLVGVNGHSCILKRYRDAILPLRGWDPPLTLKFRRAPVLHGTLLKMPTSINEATTAGKMVNLMGIKSWQSRWFELQGGELAYFKKEGGERKGAISLEGTRVSVVPAASLDGRQHCFKCEGRDGNQLVLQARDAAEMMSWGATLYMAAAIASGGGYILQMEIQRMLGQAALWHRKAAEASDNAAKAKEAGDSGTMEQHEMLRDAATMFAEQAELSVAEGRYANEEEEMERSEREVQERVARKREKQAARRVEEGTAEAAAKSDSDDESEDERDLQRMRSHTHVTKTKTVLDMKKAEIKKRMEKDKQQQKQEAGAESKAGDEQLQSTQTNRAPSTEGVADKAEKDTGGGGDDDDDADLAGAFEGFVEESGHLVKRPVRDPNGQWKRRFFVLRGGRLAYFKDRTGATNREAVVPSGVYFIHSNSVVIEGIGTHVTPIHTKEEGDADLRPADATPRRQGSGRQLLPPPSAPPPAFNPNAPPPSFNRNTPPKGGKRLPAPKSASPKQAASPSSGGGKSWFGKSKKKATAAESLAADGSASGSRSASPEGGGAGAGGAGLTLLQSFESRDSSGSGGVPEGTETECCLTVYTRAVAVCVVAVSVEQRDQWAAKIKDAAAQNAHEGTVEGYLKVSEGKWVRTDAGGMIQRAGNSAREWRRIYFVCAPQTSTIAAFATSSQLQYQAEEEIVLHQNMGLVGDVEILSNTDNYAFALFDQQRGEHVYFMAASGSQATAKLDELKRQV